METPAVRRIAFRVAYDGTDYSGWQVQPGERTVQGVFEEILSRLNSDIPVRVTGSGRTDSGVHATGQVAHADFQGDLDDATLLQKIRRMSPADVTVDELKTVSEDFHARYGAHRREYRYGITLRRDPFLHRFQTYLSYRPDLERLIASGRRLLGKHDFTAFSKVNEDVERMECHIRDVSWSAPAADLLEFRIVADRFLYGMVRLLVGVQLDVARGARTPGSIEELLANRNRQDASPAAPANGLFLHRVSYPEPIFQREPPQPPFVVGASVQ